MSLTMHVFLNHVDDALVPKWLTEFERVGMTCEFHPDFSFENQTGFLPIKLKLKDPVHEDWKEKHYLTGFEFYLDDFDIQKERQARTPRPSFLQSLFRSTPKPATFISEERDTQLAKYSKMITLAWGSGDTFGLRMANVSAAILAKLTDGVCSFQFDEWYETAGSIEKLEQGASDYEAHLKPREFRTHEFDGWR